MKKIIIVLVVLLSFHCFVFFVSAEEIYDEKHFEESIFSNIDNDTAEVLEDFGIDNLDINQIYSVSFAEIVNYFSEDLKSIFGGCVADVSMLLCIILIVSTANSVFNISNNDNFFGLISTILTTIIVTYKINPLINTILSTMKTNGSFMLAYIPVFTLLIALSGSPSAGITYNTLTLIFSEGISIFINNFATGLIGAFFSLSISFSVNPTVNLNRFINSANRTVGFILGFLSSIFAAILSIKSITSVAIDSVSVKGIRFLLSSLIPIVGSAISDAYSSLVGSINLIKGSVAIVGILVVLIISFPAIVEGFLYCISFSILSDVAQVLNCSNISLTLRIFHSGLRTLLLMNIFEIFILVISTGIMLTLKGGL